MKASACVFAGWLLTAVCLIGPASVHAQTPTERLPSIADPESLGKRFDQVVERIRKHFYDKQLAAQRLPIARVREYRSRAVSVASLPEFSEIVNQLLAELKTSHCSYWLNTTPQFYELRAIFGRHGLQSDDKMLRTPWIGVVARRIEEQWFAQAVLTSRNDPSEPEILAGDRLVEVNGEPFEPIRSLAPHIDETIELKIERSPGQFLTVRRKVDLVHPAAPYVEDMLANSRVIEHQGLRIGYCRIWWMGRPETYAAAFHALLTLKDCDAVVVDLRDGWGGQPYDYFALFDREAAVCLFEGPVAVLINDGTRSAKEVVAYDFKSNRRGLLVGAKTRGSVMPSMAFPIGEDGLLVLAVGKMSQKEYADIEGAGVEPDLSVPFDVRYSQGKDPQLQAALAAIVERLPRAAQFNRPRLQLFDKRSPIPSIAAKRAPDRRGLVSIPHR